MQTRQKSQYLALALAFILMSGLIGASNTAQAGTTAAPCVTAASLQVVSGNSCRLNFTVNTTCKQVKITNAATGSLVGTFSTPTAGVAGYINLTCGNGTTKLNLYPFDCNGCQGACVTVCVTITAPCTPAPKPCTPTPKPCTPTPKPCTPTPKPASPCVSNVSWSQPSSCYVSFTVTVNVSVRQIAVYKGSSLFCYIPVSGAGTYRTSGIACPKGTYTFKFCPIDAYNNMCTGTGSYSMGCTVK